MLTEALLFPGVYWTWKSCAEKSDCFWQELRDLDCRIRSAEASEVIAASAEINGVKIDDRILTASERLGAKA